MFSISEHPHGKARRLDTCEAPATRSTGRRGVAILELIGALAVLAVLLAFAGQWTGAMMQQRRGIERKRLAMDATSNVMALAMAASFEEVTKASLDSMAGPYTPERGQWKIEVEDVPLEISPDKSAKKIVVGLEFGDAVKHNPRQLVAWKYPIDESAEDSDG